MSAKIRLTAWAAARYDPAPSLWTIRRWAREGQIYPPPELVGREYYVEPTAKRITADMPRESLVGKLRAEA